MVSNTLILTVEPFVGAMPQDIRALAEQGLTDQQLAQIFAIVANHAGNLMCDLQDSRDQWLSHAFYQWDEVESLLLGMILDRLILEGNLSEKPKTGTHYAIIPFMLRNGYRNGSGWWLQKGDKDYPVRCPLMDGEYIEEGVCFDIHMVVQGEAPKYTAPKQAVNKENFQAICNACPCHQEV